MNQSRHTTTTKPPLSAYRRMKSRSVTLDPIYCTIHATIMSISYHIIIYTTFLTHIIALALASYTYILGNWIKNGLEYLFHNAVHLLNDLYLLCISLLLVTQYIGNLSHCIIKTRGVRYPGYGFDHYLLTHIHRPCFKITPRV